MKYTTEIIDDGESYDPTDVEPKYDLPAIREHARREGREYRGILWRHPVKLARNKENASAEVPPSNTGESF
jgi:hypothetical protein